MLFGQMSSGARNPIQSGNPGESFRKFGSFEDALKNSESKLYDLVRKEDETMIQVMKEDIDNMLVFVSHCVSLAYTLAGTYICKRLAFSLPWSQDSIFRPTLCCNQVQMINRSFFFGLDVYLLDIIRRTRERLRL